MGLPHQEGYIRADRKDDMVAAQRSQGQGPGQRSQGHQQQQQQGRREDDGDPFGVHNGRLAPRYFAFDEMTHSAFMPKLVPQPPFAPPDDLLRNFGSRR